MEKTIMVCDICGEEVEPKQFYRVRVKSDAFINYANYDCFDADKRTIDICKNCVDDFLKCVQRRKNDGR